MKRVECIDQRAARRNNAADEKQFKYEDCHVAVVSKAKRDVASLKRTQGSGLQQYPMMLPIRQRDTGHFLKAIRSSRGMRAAIEATDRLESTHDLRVGIKDAMLDRQNTKQHNENKESETSDVAVCKSPFDGLWTHRRESSRGSVALTSLMSTLHIALSR